MKKTLEDSLKIFAEFCATCGIEQKIIKSQAEWRNFKNYRARQWFGVITKKSVEKIICVEKVRKSRNWDGKYLSNFSQLLSSSRFFLIAWGPQQSAGPKPATLSLTIPSAFTVVDCCVHHRQPLPDSSIHALRRRTWVHWSWDSRGVWGSHRHTRDGAIQVYRTISESRPTTILRPLRRLNRSCNPNPSVNFCCQTRTRRNVSCCRCNRIRRRTECTTVPMDLCRRTTTTTITQHKIITTPRHRDHRRSEVQTEPTSATWKIKTSSVSCVATRARANITDSSHAKVSVKANGGCVWSAIGAWKFIPSGD